jgi:hypothetical protein
MLNVTQLLSAEVANRLAANFSATFGADQSEHLKLATRATHEVLGRIATSDALYHNVEHTTYVTLVGVQILLGKQTLEGDVSPDDWLNVVIALLCHDIGYVRGINFQDRLECVGTGVQNQTAALAYGGSDATLMPIHVDRGKRFVADNFGGAAVAVDVDAVQACIERTRFPVPPDAQYQNTADLPGLVRGADLIGQMSDPRYLHKLAAVFYEFEEIGFNANTGYRHPRDLRAAYPGFFARNVAPFIAASEKYLEQTAEGREILRSLYHNLESAHDDVRELRLQA